MSLQLANLSARTRQCMLAELELDLAQGKLYLSPRLSEIGRKEYENLLRRALNEGNDATLADGLRANGMLAALEERRKPDGSIITARVPVTAPETLAEGEFNRFYIRGVCRRAVEDNVSELVIYRAKQVDNPRPDSEAKIRKMVSAKTLLEDLRTHQGIDTALGLPAGPNSGLSVRLA